MAKNPSMRGGEGSAEDASNEGGASDQVGSQGVTASNVDAGKKEEGKPAEAKQEMVSLTREELNTLLRGAANEAATAAVALIQSQAPVTKETVVLKAREARNQDVETAKILGRIADKAMQKEKALLDGHWAFSVTNPSQPKADRIVCAGSPGSNPDLAAMEAKGKYEGYYGIIATMEIGKHTRTDLLGPADEFAAKPREEFLAKFQEHEQSLAETLRLAEGEGKIV